jgi:exodeoxyribonuclease VII small subunit
MGERRPSDPPPASAPQPDAPGAVSFEAALERLEAIVDRLERGELELEQALACFEEGVALTRQCAAQLDRSERRIEVLVREGDAWIARPFDEGGAEDPGDPGFEVRRSE